MVLNLVRLRAMKKKISLRKQLVLNTLDSSLKLMRNNGLNFFSLLSRKTWGNIAVSKNDIEKHAPILFRKKKTIF